LRHRDVGIGDNFIAQFDCHICGLLSSYLVINAPEISDGFLVYA
jgi:hypothetical protein